MLDHPESMTGNDLPLDLIHEFADALHRYGADCVQGVGLMSRTDLG
jgi:hypothetical protein